MKVVKCVFCNKPTDQLRVVPITKDQKLWAKLCLECCDFYIMLFEDDPVQS
ncbi:hypothetical protein MUO14_06890 [Halobacillus shinanisalinarum]|uniref:SR1 protein n=1 Tax=Halobacillus shinanisalinarum TaxID=2932258 RepID=A0ABY4H514_9BACI|nr:hypothetical protein [Halobacillus shinanisalinarum]UOQ94667.1 hypothetical protein MUO14_06890 [Halobacillus shinanisalinarum]